MTRSGELLTTGLQRIYGIAAMTAAVFGVQAMAALAMPLLARGTAGAVVTVIGFGFGIGFGVATIAKPVLLAERYDTSHYATLAGILVVPSTLAKAAAPLDAAWLHSSTGTYSIVLVAVAACCAVAAASTAALRASS